MPDLARTVFLPEDWNVPSDDKANETAESGTDDTAVFAEETVTLPPETLVEIAAINDTSQIEQRKATVTTEIYALEKQAKKLNHSASALASEVRAIEEELTKVQKLLDKKRDEYRSVQDTLCEINLDHTLKSQEFSALEQQEKTILARQLFDEVVASGRSIEEILNFLRGNPGAGSPLLKKAFPNGGQEYSDTKIEQNAAIEQNTKIEQNVTDLLEDSVPSGSSIREAPAIADNRNQEADKTSEEEERLIRQGSSEMAIGQQPVNEARMRKRRSSFPLRPEWEDEFNALWDKIETAQGQTFFTLRGLPFQYEVKGRQIFVDRKGKAITESSLRLSFHQTRSGQVTGPHSLKTFGASYVWSIFRKFGIIPDSEGQSKQ